MLLQKTFTFPYITSILIYNDLYSREFRNLKPLRPTESSPTRLAVTKVWNLMCNRGHTEDIIHYFTLMSSELHHLDIILKIKNLTLMSSASGKTNCRNTHIFVILPVLFLFSHVLNASEQLQLLIYALLSLKCRELHLRVF